MIKSRSSIRPPLELELLEDELLEEDDELELLDDELELLELLLDELEEELELLELLELEDETMTPLLELLLEELELEDELELLDGRIIPEELEEDELEDDELLEPGGKIPPPQATSAADIMPTTAKRKDSVLTLLNLETDIAMTPRKMKFRPLLPGSKNSNRIQFYIVASATAACVDE